MTLSYTAIAGVGVAVVLASALAMLPVTRPQTPTAVRTESVAIKDPGPPLAKTIRTIPISPLQQPVVLAPMTLPAPVAAAAPETGAAFSRRANARAGQRYLQAPRRLPRDARQVVALRVSKWRAVIMPKGTTGAMDHV